MILNRNVLLKILISGIVMAIGTIGLFIYELNTANDSKAMTIAFTLFVIFYENKKSKMWIATIVCYTLFLLFWFLMLPLE